MLDDIETERENAQWRISENGLGAELVRKRTLDKLKSHIDAFYAHASLADLVALEEALELREDVQAPSESATLVEAFLEMLGCQVTGEP
jgi:hypothetical protein